MNKEAFLTRVRQALHTSDARPPQAPPALFNPLEDWDQTEVLARFTAELNHVGGHTHIVSNIDEARASVRDLVTEMSAASYLRSHDTGDELINSLLEGISIPEATTPADADVGITAVAYAIAFTGTIVLTSDHGGRTASLLPMHHIFVLRAQQIYPTMLEALEQGLGDRDQHPPTAWVQATGPSRTADIELTLTTGVHGPGVVHAIILQ